MTLQDIAFPYRRQRAFGVSSFALLFVTLFVEIELVVFVALALVARRADLFLDFQPLVVPAAALVSLVAAGVFAWRARRWSRSRMRSIGAWGAGASGYAERLAEQRRSR